MSVWRDGVATRVVILATALGMMVGCHALRGRKASTPPTATKTDAPTQTTDKPDKQPELIVPPTLTDDDGGEDTTFRKIEVATPGENEAPAIEAPVAEVTEPPSTRVLSTDTHASGPAPGSEPAKPPPEPPPVVKPRPVGPPASASEMKPLVAMASRHIERAIQPLPNGWRCSDDQMRAIADPKQSKRIKAESDLLAQWHWKTIAALTPPMSRSDQTWPEMRWIYLKDGICEPEMFVLAGVSHYNFLGHSLYVHATMARKLDKAQALLKRKKFKSRFRYIGSFTPRTVRGPGATPGRISHHAHGMAIDIDPMTNPYFSRRELKLVEEISGVRLERGRGTSAALKWKIFDKASKRYKQRVGRWIRKQKAKVKKYERQSRKGSKAKRKKARRRLREAKRELKLVTQGRHLTQARKTGLTTLPKTFVMSMEKAGLVWGTHFPAGADMMHFATPGEP